MAPGRPGSAPTSASAETGSSRWEISRVRPLGAAESLSFTLIDRAPADSDPTAELQAFAHYLLTLWLPGPTGGC